MSKFRVTLAISLLVVIVSVSGQTLPGPLFKREPAPPAQPVAIDEVFDIAVTLDRAAPGPYQLLPGNRRTPGYVCTAYVREVSSSCTIGRVSLNVDATNRDRRVSFGEYDIALGVQFDGERARAQTEVTVFRNDRLVARQRATMRFAERVY